MDLLADFIGNVCRIWRDDPGLYLVLIRGMSMLDVE